MNNKNFANLLNKHKVQNDQRFYNMSNDFIDMNELSQLPQHIEDMRRKSLINDTESEKYFEISDHYGIIVKDLMLDKT